jgi:NADH-quinone oxidoreductase subunit J
LVAAAMAVVGGIGVIAFREPIRSVLSLVVVMVALSVLFLLLSAQFVFVVQIIVYAGAVMVLFLFVIALIGPNRETARGRLRFQPWLSALFAAVFLVLNWTMLQGVQYRQPEATNLDVFGTVQWIGVELFTRYLYPFELTSILLLVAAIGAIYLSRRGGPPEDALHTPADSGGTLPGKRGGSPVEGLRPAADSGGTLPPSADAGER